MSGLLGSSIAGLMDPSYYYRFTIEEADLQLVIAERELRPSDSQGYYIKIMRDSHGPIFWHRWWWQPPEGPGVTLYERTLEGNHFLLLHDPETGLVHLYIQNT